MMTSHSDTLEVLLVEDNPTDILLMKEAFEAVDYAFRLHVCRDGVEALDFLLQCGPDEVQPRPAVILLDLNLPRMNGHEVLAWIGARPELASIPVLVLTTSQNEQDRERARLAGARRYVIKPMDFDEFCRFVQSLSAFRGQCSTPEAR